MAKPLKIIIFPGSLGGGGVGVAFRNLCNAFDSLGHNITVISLLPAPASRHPQAGVCYTELNISRGILSLPVLVKTFRDLKPNVIYTAHEHLFIWVFLALRITGLRSKICLIHTVHNHLPSEWSYANIKKRSALLLFNRLCGQADCLLSPARIPHIQRAKQHAVIPNIVTVKKTTLTIKPSETKMIVAAGRLVKQKNYDLLIRAFAQIVPRCDAKLMLIGEGPERKNLIARVLELNLEKHVQFIGQIDEPHVHLSNADLVVSSSNWEGFGMTIAEALCLSVPVVATDCPVGPSDFLTIGKGIKLVPQNNTKQLAKAMLEYLQQPPIVKKEAFQSAFSAEKIALQHIELIQSLTVSNKPE